MADINMPSGYGGLLRYNEEYPSKLQLSPTHIVVGVILIILFVIVLKIFFPVSVA